MEKSLKFIQRARALFILSSDSTTPVPIVDWLKDITDKNGTAVAVQPTQAGNGNYFVALDDASWRNGVTGFQRVATLVDIHRKLTDYGVPESTDSGQVLNLIHSAPPRGDSNTRSARIGMWLNIAALETKAQGQNIQGPNPLEARLADSIGAFISAGGDPDMALTMQDKYGKMGTAALVGIFEAAAKKLGNTPVEHAEAPMEDQAPI